jgi:type IV secretory pathway TrbL component
MVTGYKSYTPFLPFPFSLQSGLAARTGKSWGNRRPPAPASPFISWEALVRGSKIRQGLSPAREAILIWAEKAPKHREIAHGARHVLASQKSDCEETLVSH